MSTIRDIILATPGPIPTSLAPALEAREQQIKDMLRRAITSEGYSEQQINDLFIDVGLEERITLESSSNGHAQSNGLDAEIARLSARFDDLDQLVKRLETAARRAGVAV